MARLEVATKEWSEASDAIAALRDHQSEIRRLHDRLQAELVSLRRVLALELGTAHPDYQKLRLARAATPDLDDDLAIEPGDPAGDELDALEGSFEAPVGVPAAASPVGVPAATSPVGVPAATSAGDASGSVPSAAAVLQAVESA